MRLKNLFDALQRRSQQLIIRLRPVTDRLLPWFARRRILSHKKARAILLAVPLIAFVWAGHISWVTSVYALYGTPHDVRSLFGTLFGIPASLGFALLWAQVMVTINLTALREYFIKLDLVRRVAAIFTLTLLATHPILLMLAVTPKKYFALDFVTKTNIPAAIVGELALFTVLAAGLTALLLKLPFFRHRRRLIDYLIYAAFALGLYHSGVLGPASRLPEAKALWFFYAITVGATAGYRIIRRLRRR